MSIQIQLRRDTAANWMSVDPVLAEGEEGFDTTNNRMKIGDGSTVWSSLPYIASPLPLLSITQTDLGGNFNASGGTSEEEVVGLRTSLPIIDGTFVVKVTFKGYVITAAGDNNIRTRIGTSTSYLTNFEADNLYVGGAKTLESLNGIVIGNYNLSTQTYCSISVQNSIDSTGMAMSASGARTTVIIEIYG